MPAFIFMSLYESDIDFSLFVKILLFLSLYAFVTFLLTRFIARVLGLDRGQSILFTNSNLFYNAGNYGVPVKYHVFRRDPCAMSVPVLVVVLQSRLDYAYGRFA